MPAGVPIRLTLSRASDQPASQRPTSQRQPHAFGARVAVFSTILNEAFEYPPPAHACVQGARGLSCLVYWAAFTIHGVPKPVSVPSHVSI